MATHPLPAALAAVAVGASLFVCRPVRAQLAPAPPVQAVQPDRVIPGAPIPEQIAPPAGTMPQGGVINPPAGVDPGIRKPVPDPNPDAMTVIPPHG